VSMTLYAAIELLGGKCLALVEGAAAQAPAYTGDPLEAARRWRLGAEWLHVVDLDGTLAGTPQHLDVVRALAGEANAPLQVAGGLRTEANLAAAFEAGAARVVLGSEEARKPELLSACLARWGDKIAVALDARGESMTVAGWFEIGSEPVVSFARRMAQSGVQTLLVANVHRDGTAAGGDDGALAALRAALPSTRLIVTGGAATLADIRALAAGGMDGVVLGRALYDGSLDLAEALRVARETAPAGK